MPVYAYIRVSHIDSATSGLSPEVQQLAVQARFDYELRKGADPNVWKWGSVGWKGTRSIGIDTTDGLWIDRAVSAFKVGIGARPAGKRMDRVLRKGDTLIIARLDRAFRSARDFVNQTALWQGRGIRLIFIAPDVDLATNEGKLFAGMAALWAEYESGMKSERNKEIYEYQKRQGLRGPGQGVGLGWMEDPDDRRRRDRNPKDKTPIRLIEHNEERRYIRRMVQLHDQHWTFAAISDHLERERARAENRPYRYYPEFDGKPRRQWPPAKVKKAVAQWRAGKIPPPTDEPLDPAYAAQMAVQAALRKERETEQEREQSESIYEIMRPKRGRERRKTRT